MNKTELKKTVTKIKKFLKQKDYEAIDTGIELARGLDEPAVFEALLGGWSINEESSLEFDSGFSGETLLKKWSDKAWPYLSYALINLIGYAPAGAKVHESLVRSDIRALSLDVSPWTELPRGLEGFEHLTTLVLSGCSGLRSLDRLANLAQLTSLELRDLACLDADLLAKLAQLTTLKLSNCEYLKSVEGLAHCTELTSLVMSDCKGLENLDGLADLAQLTSLELVGCKALRDLAGLTKLTQLTSLNLQAHGWGYALGYLGCREIRNLDALAKLSQLTDLTLMNFRALDNVDGLAHCTQLIRLDLSSCEILQNLDGLANLPQLTTLSLRNNEALKNVDFLANCNSLTSLDLSVDGGLATSCSLQNVDGLAGCTSLISLNLTNCIALENVDGLAGLTQLTSLELGYYPVGRGRRSPLEVLQRSEVLSNLTQLTCLDLSGRALPQVADCFAGAVQLVGLKLSMWESLDNVRFLANCPQLTSLVLSDCTALQDLGGLANCPQLTSLVLSDCWVLQDVDGLAKCTQLTSIVLSDCSALQNLNGLTNCAKLTSLELGGCSGLQNLDGLANLAQLTSLDMSNYALQNVDGLANCLQLTKLALSDCSDTGHEVALQNVDGLASCTQLISLDLSGCDALQNVDPLANCTQLTSLDLSGCNALQNVNALANCTQLTYLNLSMDWRGNSLQNVDGLANLAQLTILKLGDCEHVSPRPSADEMMTRSKVAAYQESITACVMADAVSADILQGRSDRGASVTAAERKKNVAKIKKLLKQHDFATINKGVEMARELNDPLIFESLLGGWYLGEVGGGGQYDPLLFPTLVFDKSYTGETLAKSWAPKLSKAQPYNSYALVSLMGFAPEGTKVHPTLVRSEVTALNLDIRGWTELPPGLAGLENLTSLYLRAWEVASSGRSRYVNEYYCVLRSVDALADLPKLTSLDLHGCEDLRPEPPQSGKSPGPTHIRVKMTTREEVAAYQNLIKSSIA